MKLVKSLLLGSAAGLLAVVSSQAADLPYRKAAPVEYVKVCTVHGVGFFYIPGTDTCLKVGGNVTFEYQFKSVRKVYNGNNQPVFTRSRDEPGSYARGRLQLDARNVTAWGTLRTFVSADLNHKTGLYGFNSDVIDVDKAFVQWAGLTAGRVQSVFDFYADAWNYDGIRNSDNDSNVIAYTATFGGGFTATISVEDHNDRVIGSSAYAYTTAGSATTAPTATLGTSGNNGGYRSPDFVGQLNFSQAWGQIQVAGAAHQQIGVILPAVRNTGVDNTEWGYAVMGGIDLKLPMFAAGDELFLQGQYSHGALGYMLNGSRYFNSSGLTAANSFQDSDGIFVQNAAGRFTQRLPDAYLGMIAFQHFFSPTIHGAIYASYINVDYPAAVRAFVTPATPFTSSWDEFRIGGQLVYEPVANFNIGVEAMYARLEQKLPNATMAGRNAVTGLPNFNRNIDGFEGRVHVERDF